MTMYGTTVGKNPGTYEVEFELNDDSVYWEDSTGPTDTVRKKT